MNTYRYRPVAYFATTYLFTWALWFAAAAMGPNALTEGPAGLLMVIGLTVPGFVGLTLVLTSKSKSLKDTYRKTIFSFSAINWKVLGLACLLYLACVAASIVFSCAFGQSLDQFSWAEGFSFADGGALALATLVLAAILEEWGWRGYGEDSIADRCSWFSASIVFGVVWSLWHLPLFFIGGTYQNTLTMMGPLYVANFFVSGLPLTFILTWVYVKSDRSMASVVLLHFFVNFCQEKIALTPETKCLETLVVLVLAVCVVLANRDLFFSRDHIGKLAQGSFAARTGKR